MEYLLQNIMQSTDFESFSESQLCFLVAERVSARYLSILNFSFPIFKTRIIKVSSIQGFNKDQIKQPRHTASHVVVSP